MGHVDMKWDMVNMKGEHVDPVWSCCQGNCRVGLKLVMLTKMGQGKQEMDQREIC